MEAINGIEIQSTEVKRVKIEALLTPDQVMEILGIDEDMFRKLVFNKKLKKTKVGSLLRFQPEVIKNFIDGNTES